MAERHENAPAKYRDVTAVFEHVSGKHATVYVGTAKGNSSKSDNDHADREGIQREPRGQTVPGTTNENDHQGRRCNADTAVNIPDENTRENTAIANAPTENAFSHVSGDVTVIKNYYVNSSMSDGKTENSQNRPRANSSTSDGNTEDSQGGQIATSSTSDGTIENSQGGQIATSSTSDGNTENSQGGQIVNSSTSDGNIADSQNRPSVNSSTSDGNIEDSPGTRISDSQGRHMNPILGCFLRERRRIKWYAAVCGGVIIIMLLIAVIVVIVKALSNAGTKFQDCPAPPNISYGEMQCSAGNELASICTTDCTHNHVIQGEKDTICQNGNWSEPFPTCICENCWLGEKCELSENFGKTMIGCSQDQGTSQLQYINHQISCEVKDYVADFRLRFLANCKDKSNPSFSVKCKGYGSAAGACEHGLSELVRRGIGSEKYPAPCDPSSMKQGCGT